MPSRLPRLVFVRQAPTPRIRQQTHTTLTRPYASPSSTPQLPNAPQPVRASQ
ncbi:hypothetical protein BU26DRAFT_520887 [Trematosphaeria pertusa]|uniref:Uncharacterized protein n=1 Tax=Trematosphaeria pertusa TaxID=390896 RepID=A0A6A6I8K2_9PLEO|nr:uncharacterized protein BU26DRAFT_520887 [Trematosphaeria pertusa]KAF2246408.1 hypothetical protein BU26DRAFT_520887 [Trematosphaeria pertusa]